VTPSPVFLPLRELAALVRSRDVSPVAMAEAFLERLETLGPRYNAVVTVTRQRALDEARRAEAEIAAGRWRGPLHGIPYGAKDLLATGGGVPTTWGAAPLRRQTFDADATVIRRLEEAGAVLAAKLAMVELAGGAGYRQPRASFTGPGKSPWADDAWSGGSSSGSASAVSAGLVPFALGSETWGSIVSPAANCGVTGLRPTLGRVSRHGAMALAWTMDKAGPIARSVEDCAAVFGAIHGADGLDRSAVDRPFSWPADRAIESLRIGYVEDLFDADYTQWAEKEEEKPGLREWNALDRKTLDALRGMGLKLVSVKLPSLVPVGALGTILTAEAAAAFDELTRSGKDAALVRQVADAWPNVFRQGQLVPAVEYLRASRLRTMLMREMEALFETIDVYVVPSFGGDNLLLTNLTGHPAVVLPNGFLTKEGTPTSITFQGRLHGESDVLAVAHAYQRATGFHLRRPSLAKAS
jgi:Asp-tRNA(Asn)/Glu-tRNA(Gln) amidotransferase A subunit family amidase